MTRNSGRWSAEEEAVMRQYYLQERAAEVARRLSRTPGMVYKKAQLMGLEKVKRWRTGELRTVVALLLDDSDPDTRPSQRQISQKLQNRSQMSVGSAITRYKLQRYNLKPELLK